MKPVSRRAFLKAFGKAAARVALGNTGRRLLMAEEGKLFQKIISTKKGGVRRVIIESYPDVDSKEVSLYKLRGTRGEVIDGMTKRSAHGTDSTTPLPEKIKSITHTHSIKYANPDLSNNYKAKRMMYFSPKDFRAIIAPLEKGLIRKPITFHIATINEAGKIIGYTSILLGKRFLENYGKQNEGLLTVLEKIWSIPDGAVETAGQIDAYTALVYRLKEFGAVIKGRPMPGYIFNNKTFEKR